MNTDLIPVSAMYYVINVHTLIILGDPKYYSKEAWIKVFTGTAT